MESSISFAVLQLTVMFVQNKRIQHLVIFTLITPSCQLKSKRISHIFQHKLRCSPDQGRAGTGSETAARHSQSAPATGGWLPEDPESLGCPGPALFLRCETEGHKKIASQDKAAYMAGDMHSLTQCQFFLTQSQSPKKDMVCIVYLVEDSQQVL